MRPTIVDKLPTPAPHCPECNNKLDGFASLDGYKAPRPGDLTVCAYCHAYLEFTADMKLRALSNGEKQSLSTRLRRQLDRALTFLRIQWARRM